MNAQNAFKYGVSSIDGGWMQPPWFGEVIEPPLTFTSSQSGEELADQLYDGLMSRLESDIDTLVFTRPEQITEVVLEPVKNAFTIGSVAVALVSPGTGSVLARFAVFMASLSLDAGAVAASALQSHLSHRPDQAAAFRTEAIIAGVLGAFGAVAGVKAAYSLKNVNQALSLYKEAKAVSQRMLPSVLREMK